MRQLKLICAAVAVAALLAPVALAQELGGADRVKVSFNEVEHGGYAGAEFGLLYLEAPGIGRGLGGGNVIGLHLGYDFSQYLGVGFFAMVAAVSSPVGYGGLGDGTQQGDFTAILPGLEVRLHLPLAKDQNDVNRLFFNLGLGGGVMFLQPRALFPSEGIAPAGKVDVGLEYFTRLRHFSMGLALEALAAFPSGGQIFGGDLAPFLRYTF